MARGLVRLPENRVRRNYTGGAGIDALRGKARQTDNNMPEEWIGSMVEAYNPGMEPIPHEGLATVETGSGVRFLRDIVDEDRSYYLGFDKEGPWRLSFLFKILDSSMRLHIQAHPTTEFAKRAMGKPYGKLECYYILNVREGISPYILLGFQHSPGREGWKRIVESQDKPKMIGCFEKIPVRKGEVWHIPGGMPHAIGEGITLLEIMEPSDLVVRCEFEREGIVVPEEGRFMGRGLDFCLDIFDYNEYSKDQIISKCRIEPRTVEQTKAFKRVRLVDERMTSCFFVEKLELDGSAAIAHNGKFTLGVVCAGSCRIEQGGDRLDMRPGESFMIAAGVDSYRVASADKAEIAFVYPGSDMYK